MSISYSARVVCGFKLEIQPVSKSVTKYNQDTGEPYQVRVTEHEEGTIDGIPIRDTSQNADLFCNGETIEGLTVGESGYEIGQKWLGIVVVKVGEYDGDFHGDFHEFNLVVPDEIHEFAAKYKLENWHWFLSMSCG